MLLAALIIIAFITRAPHTILLGVAALFFVGTLYAHYTTFGDQYKFVNTLFTASSSGATPYLMSGLVIALVVGYLLYLFSGNQLPSLPSMPASMPSANSATNYLTRGINHGLSSLGVPAANQYTTPSQSPNQGRNQLGNQGRNYLASAVNYRV